MTRKITTVNYDESLKQTVIIGLLVGRSVVWHCAAHHKMTGIFP